MSTASAAATATNKFCSNCRHHSSFHQLVTRDKWQQMGSLVVKGRIPWFCEYINVHPVTQEEHICACTDFDPTSEGMS